MPDARPTPKETAENIRLLLKRGLLSEASFREIHHMRRSASEFRKYCDDREEFIYDSRNHRLAMKLRQMMIDGQ
ncbi:MAG TPA: hypothetical protein VME23_20500 [Terracidiphilus sp.]|nr:hypothetical protein [Terracidiphilus sp.]